MTGRKTDQGRVLPKALKAPEATVFVGEAKAGKNQEDESLENVRSRGCGGV
jgi:hypothetical protein